MTRRYRGDGADSDTGTVGVFRTLVISEGLPYPTSKGGDLRTWQNINALMSVGEVGVFGLCSNDARREKAPAGVALWRSTADPALAYPPPQGRRLEWRAWPLDPKGHPSDLYYSETAATELERLASEFGPDAVVIEGLWLYRYIKPLRRLNCPIILDSVNVESALYQRRADVTTGNGLHARLIREVLPDRTRKIERRATHAVDQIWVCSSADARLMMGLHAPPAPIHVVANGVDVESYHAVHVRAYDWPESVDPVKRPLLFLGMFSYWPNEAAAIFLIEEIFPRLAARRPDCQLLLVGTMPTSRMREAAQSDSRIVVTGAVPDTRPYLAAASVLAVPLFEGGGTRFKILEALAAGVPVVSTAKGAEGLHLENGTHLLFAETADEFVDGVLRIWADEPLKNRLMVHGRDLVKELYSWPVACQQIRQALQELTSTDRD